MRAVLAHAPALGFELALAGGRLEGTLGEPAGAILFRIEPRKILSEDLAFHIALEALGARIPTGDDPRRIEHVDGIVGDRVDEELEASFLRR